MFVGLILILASLFVLMLFASHLKAEHDGFADFVRLVSYGICGAIAVLGVLFIKWAFAEGDRTR
jgi:hypothetical protein